MHKAESYRYNTRRFYFSNFCIISCKVISSCSIMENLIINSYNEAGERSLEGIYENP